MFYECVSTIRFYCTIFGRENYDIRESVEKWLAQREEPGNSYLIGFCIYIRYRENLRKSPPMAEAFYVWLDKIKQIELSIAEKNDKIPQHAEKWRDVEMALK